MKKPATLEEQIRYLNKCKEFVKTWSKTGNGFPYFENYKNPSFWFVENKFVELRHKFFVLRATKARWYIKDFKLERTESDPVDAKIALEEFTDRIDQYIKSLFVF